MPESIRLTAKEIFDFLTPDQIHAISEASEVIERKAGEMVYEAGKRAVHFFLVLKGKVALTYPIKPGFSVTIDELSPGHMFGSLAAIHMETYNLNALCLENSEILRIQAQTLKGLMDRDLRMGYQVQSKISEIYFIRYIKAIKNLKAAVLDL